MLRQHNSQGDIAPSLFFLRLWFQWLINNPSHLNTCSHAHTRRQPKSQPTSLREFIFALKWGDFNMRSRMSSRKSSTAVTRSGWKRIHSSLIPDRSSGILTSLCLKQNNNKKRDKQRHWYFCYSDRDVSDSQRVVLVTKQRLFNQNMVPLKYYLYNRNFKIMKSLVKASDLVE